MIESRFWRQELRSELSCLRQRRAFRRWSEKQQVLFERRLMLVAFQIRTLLDRPKVSHHARNAHADGRLYRKIGTHPVTLMNVIDFEDNFDLDNPEAVRLPVRELCNQLIHHYVFFAVRGEQKRFEVVLVFSDYKRHVCLYEFNVNDILDLFSGFASEKSASYNDGGYSIAWDENKQGYVWSSTP